MNKERILRLADRLDAEPKDFTMRQFFHEKNDCRTPACVAGHACAQALQDGVIDELPVFPFILRPARVYLGLSKDHTTGRKGLFAPTLPYANWCNDQPGSRSHITPRHAATVLRHLVETGEVDWTVRPEEATKQPESVKEDVAA